MNILLTSAGRRSSLIRAFKEAARGGERVLAAEVDALAPACSLCDGAFLVPRVTDEEYVPGLLALCGEQNIDLVIPTIDTELQILARNAERFRAQGVRLVLSSEGFIDICRDKWKTFLAMGAEGIAVPASWLPEHLPREHPDRLFLKPRDGSASQNIYPCRWKDLHLVLPLVPEPLVQEFLDGREITIDALLDFQGRPIHYVPRERIRTLGGESIQGVTLGVDDLDRWIESVLHVCSRLGAIGPLTLQAFLTSRGPVLTEVNPRFGGGFPLALAAGGNYPAWILAAHRGEALEPRLGDYRRGLYMTRYYSEIFLETLPWPL